MGKVIAVIVLLVVVIGVVCFLVFVVGKKPADNLPDSQTSVAQSTLTTSEAAADTTDTADTTSLDTTDSNVSAGGGNPEVAACVEITVSEDKYFYDNHEISYDDLIKVIDELGENTVVKITDENATLKSYEALTKALEEREIPYEAAN